MAFFKTHVNGNCMYIWVEVVASPCLCWIRSRSTSNTVTCSLVCRRRGCSRWVLKAVAERRAALVCHRVALHITAPLSTADLYTLCLRLSLRLCPCVLRWSLVAARSLPMSASPIGKPLLRLLCERGPPLIGWTETGRSNEWYCPHTYSSRRVILRLLM